MILEAECTDGLYYVRSTENAECRQIGDSISSAKNQKKNSMLDWHVRLGHLNA